MFTTVIGVV